MKTIFKDLLYRLEGYSDNPDYTIKSISVHDDGDIVVVCREANPKAETQAESQGAKDESDK